MDDVEIIDVNDDGEEMPVVHRRSLENQDLGMIRQTVEDFLGQYGWYLIFLTVGVILLIQYLSKKRASQANKSPSNETPQDSALIVRRQEALEASRRRLQEELDAKAVEFRERQKMLEEEKRKQKIEVWENLQEGKLKSKSDKKLRSAGYNPLTGDGGAACGWRPGRRGPSSSGG